MAGEEALQGVGDVADVGEVAESGTQVVEVPDDAVETPEQAETKARAARLALFEEKLVASREKRAGQRVIEKAKALRKEAANERRLAAEERAKYDGLKEGSYKDTLIALGRDPVKSFEEMSREAIEYSTPEAAAKREQARIDAKLEELKARQDAIDKREADQAADVAARAEQSRLVTHFQQAVADPAFEALRDEYPDEVLLDHAKHYAENPKELRQHAASHGVRLTDPHGRFTMHELLQVLSAAQVAHDTAKQARSAARRPAEAQAGKPPTVNGTADRRNAGTVTNDLASQRASPGPKVSTGSVKDRLAQSIEEEIRRYSGG